MVDRDKDKVTLKRQKSKWSFWSTLGTVYKCSLGRYLERFGVAKEKPFWGMWNQASVQPIINYYSYNFGAVWSCILLDSNWDVTSNRQSQYRVRDLMGDHTTTHSCCGLPMSHWLGTACQYCVKQYIFIPRKKEESINKIKLFLELGWTEPSSSQWCSSVLFVP